MNRLAAPAWLIAGNLAAFYFSAIYFLSEKTGLSHHWIFILLEGLVLAQAVLLRGDWLLKTLTFISLTILGVSAARLETICLSRHLIHFSLAWATGSATHLLLRTRLRNSRLFERINSILAFLCAVIATISCVVAVRQGIWWGLGSGK